MFGKSTTTETPVTVLLDGLQVTTNEAGKLAIEKLQSQLAETIVAKDSVIEGLRAANQQLQIDKTRATGLADRAAQNAVELQQQLDQRAAPAPVLDGRQVDPVVAVLRDSFGRTQVHDNGYGAAVADLDYRTRKEG